MEKQQDNYTTRIKEKYLNTEELRILRDIKTEQESYFKMYGRIEDFI